MEGVRGQHQARSHLEKVHPATKAALDLTEFKGCCYSRMPSPLLALMERPGSARFLVMEGMLTEPLKPARLS